MNFADLPKICEILNLPKYTDCLDFEIKFEASLKQFLAAESFLQMIKNAFNFILKTLFILKIFKFLSRIFRHVKKRFD